MTPDLSPNTQAILLLTAPLIIGNAPSRDLLSPAEYKRLAMHLRHMQRQPSDLMAANGSELIAACQTVVDETRLRKLLNRGFLLSQVIEHWEARGIWVISRADSIYPRRLKARLKENAPAILYGCGNIDLFESGGLAVVGSRQVPPELIDYSTTVGQLAAHSSIPIISGGAKGVDRAAMNGSLHENGYVCEVMAERLDRAALDRDNRPYLMSGQLVLVSAYDPASTFSVGHAMQRNKLIYALSDASLVVNAEVNKGGTWSGAVEQLEKLKLVKVYVRSTGTPSEALSALTNKGALPWPNPKTRSDFKKMFEYPANGVGEKQGVTSSVNDNPDISLSHDLLSQVETNEVPPVDYRQPITKAVAPAVKKRKPRKKTAKKPSLSAADALLKTVHDVLKDILKHPMKEDEIATALEVSNTQTRLWLKRLVDEGYIEKHARPARYVLAPERLFE
ncbi:MULTISPECIES: DNA-processing protein DprA [Pseudomonas]|uniref:Smf/DprA SLOG domain-containing protein n=2 Tax=Pseudomonas syringae group TaxID=136849 RepID=A0A3M4IQ54_PSEVI|nr:MULTISPECIES: DNA-processing protein DprA [Pseudomonas]KTB73847.1 DNA protecting protein DprA [Pseudomonas sp. ICMP 3272]KTC52563.1 DNA protecting protein DprA [Pseudomonas syringae ICMP 19498]RMP05050.1 hypothetical protein ALQ30_03977 [Pseudomonas syringae pv. persicae]RMQ06415.1 hypothetical protein ALQ09_03259 [Pseudomonas viridiflava]RMQ76888.1 hypothetical protein ALP98_02803 [Pseudomonas viridiflava]